LGRQRIKTGTRPHFASEPLEPALGGEPNGVDEETTQTKCFARVMAKPKTGFPGIMTATKLVEVRVGIEVPRQGAVVIVATTEIKVQFTLPSLPCWCLAI
jgi:hypothetical protein